MKNKKAKAISKTYRFSEDEYDKIKSNAAKQNTTVSEFIRKRSMPSPEESALNLTMIERNAKCEILNIILSLDLSEKTKNKIVKECSIP